MFGNLINNRQFKALREAKTFEIEPFSESNLSTVHYTLHIGKIKHLAGRGGYKTVHDFLEEKDPFILKPNEYVVVEIQEKIRLNDENLVGHFIAASNLINEGLLVVAGKIDKKFGNTGPEQGKGSEMIHFGLKNLTPNEVIIKPWHRVAHMQLFDLRGVSSEKIGLSKEELELRLKRMIYAIEDGVIHDEGTN